MASRREIWSPERQKHVIGSQKHDWRNTAEAVLDVAFKHPIKLVANALGIPPQVMMDYARANDVPVAALIGTKEHALSQVAAGVDILVAAGGEAGGHTGEISTMVLIPEVCGALAEIGDETPVLAAGGIATGAADGRQPWRWVPMRRMVWFRLANDGRGGNQSGSEGKDARSDFARYGASAFADRQAIATTSFSLDRRLGNRRCPNTASHAPAIASGGTTAAHDRQAQSG